MEVERKCRYSSVVEHVIGNDGVVSPILTSGTIFFICSIIGAFFVCGVETQKVRFYKSRKIEFFINYRTFVVKGNKSSRLINKIPVRFTFFPKASKIFDFHLRPYRNMDKKYLYNGYNNHLERLLKHVHRHHILNFAYISPIILFH